MDQVVIMGKTKIKRVFDGIKSQLDDKKEVCIIGFGDGTIKVVSLAEKLKSMYEGIDQSTEIIEESNQAGLKIHLKLV
jgi:hypothetical protein